MIHMPSPVPLMPLVVKKGSKIRDWFSGEMPVPVSPIVILTPALWRVVQSREDRSRALSLPPLGMASREFPMMLVSDWRISPE